MGARVERWEANDGALSNAVTTRDFPESQNTSVSPKAALAWAPNPTLTLKASVGRAVRLPTVAELYHGSIIANAIVNNDPDLSPERSWTSEITAACEFDHGDMRATGFFEDTSDALYSQINVAGGATVSTVQNVGHIRTRGIETTWATSVTGLSILTRGVVTTPRSPRACRTGPHF